MVCIYLLVPAETAGIFISLVQRIPLGPVTTESKITPNIGYHIFVYYSTYFYKNIDIFCDYCELCRSISYSIINGSILANRALYQIPAFKMAITGSESHLPVQI